MSAGLQEKVEVAGDPRRIVHLGVIVPRPHLDRIALTEARPATVENTVDRSGPVPPPVRSKAEARRTPPPQPALRTGATGVPPPPSDAQKKEGSSPPPFKTGRIPSGAMRPLSNSGRFATVPATGGVSSALETGRPQKAEIYSNGVTITALQREGASTPTAAEPQSEDDLAGIMGNILATGELEQRRKAAAGQGTRVSRDEWYKDIFQAEDWGALQPEMRLRHIARELQFVHTLAQIRTDFEILDVACGDGRHAVELAATGCNVTGLDLSRSLLEKGLEHADQRNVPVRFIEADMREMNFERRFDLVMCLNTSFGYFDDAENLRVLRAMARALKPGGHLILDVVNRDWAVGQCPMRTWWEAGDRVILEETRFDSLSSRLEVQRSILRDGDPNWEQHIAMRAYAVHELPALMNVMGLRVNSVSGDLAHPGVYLGAENRRLIVHATRDRG